MLLDSRPALWLSGISSLDRVVGLLGASLIPRMSIGKSYYYHHTISICLVILLIVTNNHMLCAEKKKKWYYSFFFYFMFCSFVYITFPIMIQIITLWSNLVRSEQWEVSQTILINLMKLTLLKAKLTTFLFYLHLTFDI